MSKPDSCSIVLVHLGKAYPAYLTDCLRQIRFFNSETECTIYVVSNEAHRGRIKAEFDHALSAWSFIAAESLEISEDHAAFRKRATLDQKQLDGFWHFATERFFYLHAAIRLRDLRDVFHLENDTLLYLNLQSKLSVFRRHYQVGATFDCDSRCIPGFMYFKDSEASGALCHYLALNQPRTGANDMALLAAYRTEHSDRLQPLPVVSPEYCRKLQLQNQRGDKANDPRAYSSHFDEFQGVFDAAAMGQFLGGTTPVPGETRDTSGFVSETSLYSCRNMQLEWRRDSQDRLVPYCDGYPVYNLYIHSKDLNRYRSDAAQCAIPHPRSPLQPEQATIKTKPLRIWQYTAKLLKLIGRKGSVWLGVNVASGVVLGGLEIGLSVLLALLLKSLHITESTPSLPFKLNLLQISAGVFLVLLILVGFLRGLAQLLAGHSANVATEMIGTRLRMVLLYETFRLRTGFASLSEMNVKSADIFPKATEFCYFGATAVPIIIQSIVLFCVLLERSVRETAIGISGVLLAGILIHFVTRRVRKLAGQLPIVRTQYQRRLVRSVKNWFLLKALRTMPQEHDGLIRSLLGSASLNIRAYFLGAVAAALPQVFGVLVLAILISVHLKHPSLSGVEFFSFLYIYVRLVQNLGSVANNVGILNASYPQFRIAASYFFSFPSEVISAALSPTASLSPFGANWEEFAESPRVWSQGPLAALEPPGIRFRNVGFSYEPGKMPVFSGLNVEVEAGSQLAIVGPSGSGKSTLLALVLGVLRPTEGEIMVDGVSPVQFCESPDARIAYVGAESFLIDGTVRENLLYGRSEAFTDSEMIAALQAAQLENWYLETKDPLNYLISENGEALSTGQKQRLSLARALLSKPSLLILDEISANLDVKTEAEVALTVAGLTGICTTLIVSHREGIVKHVTNRLVLGQPEQQIV